MKKIIKFIVLLFLCFCDIAYAQLRVPAIIAIDGTLPDQLQIEVSNSTKDSLFIMYHRGSFHIDSINEKIIQSFSDTTWLNVVIFYEEYYKKNMTKDTYRFDFFIRKNVFLGGDVLINITTFNKRKTKYYVDYQGNCWVRLIRYDKSIMGNYKRAMKKIKSIYPKYSHW